MSEFEDWWHRNRSIGEITMTPLETSAREAWDHQQKKIDKFQSQLSEAKNLTQSYIFVLEALKSPERSLSLLMDDKCDENIDYILKRARQCLKEWSDE